MSTKQGSTNVLQQCVQQAVNWFVDFIFSLEREFTLHVCPCLYQFHGPILYLKKYNLPGNMCLEISVFLSRVLCRLSALLIAESRLPTGTYLVVYGLQRHWVLTGYGATVPQMQFKVLSRTKYRPISANTMIVLLFLSFISVSSESTIVFHDGLFLQIVCNRSSNFQNCTLNRHESNT